MTPEGPVAYRLAWKRVKNLNLRLHSHGGGNAGDNGAEILLDPLPGLAAHGTENTG